MHWHHLISALLAVLRVDALACLIAVSECSVRKCLLLFLTVKLLPFPTGAVSVQGLLLPGTERPLGGWTSSAPTGSGSRSGEVRPSLHSVDLGCSLLRVLVSSRGFCLFSCLLDSAEGQTSPCAPACPEESPGVRQFGEFWGRWGLDQFLLSSSCAAARVHDFRSVFHLIALGVYF